jgi:hypothetical protein
MNKKRGGKDLCFFFATPSSQYDDPEEDSPCGLNTDMVESMKSAGEAIKRRFCFLWRRQRSRWSSLEGF